MKLKEGFVYILVNPSLKGMVKIGLTSNEVEERARQLSRSTGIPTEFIIVYDELVSDCHSVEKILHDRFQDFRVNPRREFFKIPAKEAIKALQQVAEGFLISKEEFQYSRSFIDDLRAKFGRYVKSDIISARIVQTNEICFF